MNKPISMLINETQKSMIAICNNSTLPPCILELVVKNILNEIHVLSQKQLQEDELTYMNYMTQTETEEEV